MCADRADRVVLLPTCVVDTVAGEVGDAVVRVLRRLGYEVTIPDDATCCGQPAWNAGFAEDAARVARTTLGALEAALAEPSGADGGTVGADSGATVVCVPAGSCAAMMRVFWPELFHLVHDEAAVERARRVGARTREFSELVAGRSGDGLAGRFPADVAYHHSCHMLRELGLHDPPEALLGRLEGCRTLDWSAAERCCGFGGMFSVKLPETSVAMADDKLDSLGELGATHLVGCDQSCLLHLQGRLHRRGGTTTVRHLAQVLDEAGAPAGAGAGAGVGVDSGGGGGPAVTHELLVGTTLRRRTADAVADDHLRSTLQYVTDRLATSRLAGAGQLSNWEELRTAARAMRADTIARLPEILERLADNWERNGGRVFWAADAAEAHGYIADLAARHGARTVVKSKSMATEEIGLNDALEAQGAKVVETDLGEWIIQLADQPPSHIIAPAIHLTRDDVQDILNRVPASDGRLSNVPEELCAFAREQLRQEFLAADLGISGCNMGVAETGSMVLVTNEGNGRMVTSLPKVHVAVMGMERVVETWEQLDLLMTLLPRAATGQDLSVYCTQVTGPRRADRGEVDGPDELHLVILDNGRSELIGGEFQEMLNCIRCGACLNVCPVYRQVGGHAYGWCYSGPMGAVLIPLLHRAEEAGELSGASTLCGACYEACPVKIPLQDLLLSLRRRRADDAPRAQRLAWSAWAAAWSRPTGYRASTAAAAGVGRVLPTKLFPDAWAAGREVPRARKGPSFRTRFRRGEL